MFAHLRMRSEVALDDICYELQSRSFLAPLHELAMEGRALTTPDLGTYQPSSSLSRLHGGEPFLEVMDRPLTPIDADAGNVKVVVRVRKFIKRGALCLKIWEKKLITAQSSTNYHHVS